MDKKLHLIMSAVLVVGLTYLFHSPLWAVVVTFFIGLAKELIDMFRPTGFFSIGDMSYNFLGIICGLSIFFVMIVLGIG